MSLGFCLCLKHLQNSQNSQLPSLKFGKTLWGLSTWRVIPGRMHTWFSLAHGDRWLLSPKDRVVGPLPNGQNLWLINGADSNHLQVLGWSSKHLVGENISFWPFHPQLTGNRFRSTKGFCTKTHGNYLKFTMKNTFFRSSCEMKPAQKAENVTCLEGQGIIYIHIHTCIYISMYLYYTQYEWGWCQWFFHQEKDALLNRNGPCSVKLQLQWHRASGQLAKLCETSQHNIASSELQSLPSRGSSARFEIWVNFIEFYHLPIVCVPFFPTLEWKCLRHQQESIISPPNHRSPWIQIHHDMWHKNSGWNQ